ncbi:MAG TPA: LPXTG cell wall anchor domain-containing protein [Candidatus Nitrosotenuis sp.]|nr:LPXTG cell wall anchor domain-containing protein [Candidatus Nitrosotenuis sp.]
MNAEWIVTGIILLGAMAAGGVSLYLKKRREALADSSGDIQPGSNEI